VEKIDPKSMDTGDTNVWVKSSHAGIVQINDTAAVALLFILSAI